MISRSTEYAIRALTYLARQDGYGPALNRQIAAELGLPPPFLSKLLRELTSRGLLLSQRGRSGGFQLARPPADITLLEIAEPFDRFAKKSLCILGQDVCNDEAGCPLHEHWKRLKGDFVALLGATTLAAVADSTSRDLFPHSRLGVLRHHSGGSGSPSQGAG